MILMLMVPFTLHIVDAIEAKDLVDLFAAFSGALSLNSALCAPHVWIKSSRVPGIS
jgi:hypothetical protein